jgi:hypothetical protein
MPQPPSNFTNLKNRPAVKFGQVCRRPYLDGPTVRQDRETGDVGRFNLQFTEGLAKRNANFLKKCKMDPVTDAWPKHFIHDREI